MTQDQRTIWIDTTTVFRTFRRGGTRVTGIPRVAVECIAAAFRDDALRDRIRLCRLNATTRSFVEVAREEFEAAVSLSGAARPTRPDLRQFLRQNLSPAMVDRLERLSSGTRRTVGRLSMGQRPQAGRGSVRHPFAAGDVWINFGCWWHDDLPEHIRDVKADTEITVMVTIHDCMPLILPEFFPREQTRLWREGLGMLEATTDTLLVVSESTAQDVRRCMPEFGGRVHRLRLGDVFISDAAAGDDDAILGRLGQTDPFALIVGTIEVRKNHVLAFRVWRELIDQGLSPPTLVIAGTWGWKVNDLAAQIEDSDHLGGRIRVIASPTDAELAALYRRSLFTIFPSHYEGWGLPVRESLAFGRICIAASNSSIVEAGAGLADLFESNCQPDLMRQVTACLDADRRAVREKEIRAGFRKNSWTDTWLDVRKAFEG